MGIQRRIYIPFSEDDGTVLILDLRALNDVGEVTFCIGSTYTTADRTVLAEGIANTIADHAVLALLAFYRAKEVRKYLVRLFTIEIIGIDDGKGFFNQVLTHQHGVVGTPGFRALGVIRAAFRHFVHRLEAELALYLTLIFAQHDAAEIIFKILTDHKDDLTKACAQSVIHTVIKDGFAVGTETVHLFETAVTASHSGCQDK